MLSSNIFECVIKQVKRNNYVGCIWKNAHRKDSFVEVAISSISSGWEMSKYGSYFLPFLEFFKKYGGPSFALWLGLRDLHSNIIQSNLMPLMR